LIRTALGKVDVAELVGVGVLVGVSVAVGVKVAVKVRVGVAVIGVGSKMISGGGGEMWMPPSPGGVGVGLIRGVLVGVGVGTGVLAGSGGSVTLR
jgi:hypothetical protein